MGSNITDPRAEVRSGNLVSVETSRNTRQVFKKHFHFCFFVFLLVKLAFCTKELFQEFQCNTLPLFRLLILPYFLFLHPNTLRVPKSQKQATGLFPFASRWSQASENQSCLSPGWHLLLGREGHIVTGTGSHIWGYKEGSLITPTSAFLSVPVHLQLLTLFWLPVFSPKNLHVNDDQTQARPPISSHPWKKVGKCLDTQGGTACNQCSVYMQCFLQFCIVQFSVLITNSCKYAI